MTTTTDTLTIPVGDLTTEQLSAIVAEMCGWEIVTSPITGVVYEERIGCVKYKGLVDSRDMRPLHAYAEDANLALAALVHWTAENGGRYDIGHEVGQNVEVTLIAGSFDIMERGRALPLAACRALVAAGRVG